jgi:hypothetical protein
VDIPGVATKTSSETYWHFQCSQDSYAGVTEEMKHKVPHACFALYEELENKNENTK